MNACCNCGLAFVPQGSIWDGETCGECIADRIEYGLLGSLLFGERKPLRRGAGSRAEAVPAFDEQVRRQA
jgi:hypothetical protein